MSVGNDVELVEARCDRARLERRRRPRPTRARPDRWSPWPGRRRRASPPSSASAARAASRPSSTPSSASIARTMSPADVVAERRGDRGRQSEPGGADGGDRASARRAQELGREPLLAERGQRLEADERQVEEDRGGDDEVGHGRPRITGRESCDERTDRVAREIRLGDEAAGAGFGHERAEVASRRGSTRARSPSARAGLAQPRGDLEPVDVRQLDVEEQDVGGELERRGDARTRRRSRCRPRRSRRSRARSAQRPGRTDGRRRSAPSPVVRRWASRPIVSPITTATYCDGHLRRIGEGARRGEAAPRPAAVRRCHRAWEPRRQGLPHVWCRQTCAQPPHVLPATRPARSRVASELVDAVVPLYRSVPV